MEEPMAEFRREGDPAFPTENENDNSSESPTEKTETEPTDSSNQDKKEDAKKRDGEDTNFANHPRWKERENDWKERFNMQEERHTSELAKIREEMGQISENAKSGRKESEPEKPPAWFNGDEESWKDYSTYHNSQILKAKEEAKSEAIKEIETKKSSEEARIKEAQGYFQKQLNEIETDSGEKVDPNKLLKFVLENDLTDSKGNWNYKAGYRLMKASKEEPKKDNKERKEVAGATTSNNRSEAKQSQFMTSKDFKGKSWGNLR